MNKKYIKYIDYIVSDIELPYLKCLEQYGLKQGEMDLVLSKVFNQSVSIKGNNRVYDINGNILYYEDGNGLWVKKEYDTNNNKIYHEDSDGLWVKKEYDDNGNNIYHEGRSGYWVKREFDSNNNLIYWEDNNGVKVDKR